MRPRVCCAVLAGLLGALIGASSLAAHAHPIARIAASSSAAIRTGLTLAQAPWDLRSAVLGTLRLQPRDMTAPDIEPGPDSDFLGWSVSVSGQTAVVGAPGVDNSAGAAY